MAPLETRSRPTLIDAMILIAAIAISWSLPTLATVTFANVSQFWSQGFWEVFLWWAILGPTLAGPVLVWRHRRERLRVSSGAALWLVLGIFKLSQIVLFHGTYTGNSRALLYYVEVIAEVGVPLALAFCLVGRGWKDRPWLDVTGIILGIAWVVYFERNLYTRNFSQNHSWFMV